MPYNRIRLRCPSCLYVSVWVRAAGICSCSGMMRLKHYYYIFSHFFLSLGVPNYPPTDGTRRRRDEALLECALYYAPCTRSHNPLSACFFFHTNPKTYQHNLLLSQYTIIQPRKSNNKYAFFDFFSGQNLNLKYTIY